ncbi:polysaccharide deacetylase family protein [Haloarcula laminariae]|uniref:polysaccharide deacetylase family protein n=1 Tax=Haloarcula laminariae TaxID=2961577 RepID=UPI002405B0C6|nr:polysaccharide deacetylase family protein [Halomicroarcula sp. FL173]
MIPRLRSTERADDGQAPLISTVDVEGHNGNYECVLALDRLLSTAEVPHTLFVTPDVVENRTELVARWVDSHHEVGLHIHPERLSGGSDWLTDYDEKEISEMLANSCRVFERELDMVPVIFRAGRWEYSDQLLRALADNGFESDASYRPDRFVNTYVRHGIREYPLTCYTNPLIKLLMTPWDNKSVALHADLFLSNLPLSVGFCSVTARMLLSDIPYLMIAYHDYDVLELADQFEFYINSLSRVRSQKTMSEILL